MLPLETSCKQKEESITRMMEQYGPSLIRTCFLYLKDAQLAEDAAQETFLKAYRNLDRFRGECSEKTWLMRIAMNTCHDIRRNSWFRFVDRRVAVADKAASEEPEFIRDSTVTQAVMNLSAKYREVILLRYYQQMTTSEIAHTLSTSFNTIKSRLLRARRLLSDELKGWYFDE
ncbi:MAG: sigma-70 family RNA polymerase sigma factor [Clostridiales bacterium]|nr:sigma-70 family RNA polymerase sigma factor [Clostridiales bacterium]